MLARIFAAAGLRRRPTDALIRQVAEQSVQAVCRLVGDRVTAMTPCEARGYIRARAAQEVRRQTRSALAQRPAADPAWQSLIIARATERVSPLAMRQLSAACARGVHLRSAEPSAIRRAA